MLSVISTMLASCVVAVKTNAALWLDLHDVLNSSHILFLFFIAVGSILVIFMLVLNLTVTQGLINGLILYANTLWTYKGILFPSELQSITFAVQVFIAWLNLDFGIETCLVVGLTAFWKTWLQFLFQLYMWLIAGVIIILGHYSSCLTNLFGDRAACSSVSFVIYKTNSYYNDSLWIWRAKPLSSGWHV